MSIQAIQFLRISNQITFIVQKTTMLKEKKKTTDFQICNEVLFTFK